jgi:hypothetical protein
MILICIQINDTSGRLARGILCGQRVIRHTPDTNGGSRESEQ